MSLIQKRRGLKDASANGRKKLTARMFLGKDNCQAYIEPATLLHFVDNGRIENVLQTGEFIDGVYHRRKFSISLLDRKDSVGEPYTYQSFLNPMGPEGKKVMSIGNMKQFIIDCHRGMFVTDFTFEQLIQEAENEN